MAMLNNQMVHDIIWPWFDYASLSSQRSSTINGSKSCYIYRVISKYCLLYIYIICLESIETSWRRQIHHQRPWHVTGDFVPPSAGCLFGWTRSLSLCRACGSAPFDSWQLSHGAQNHCWLTIVRGIYYYRNCFIIGIYCFYGGIPIIPNTWL
jgi:hypothetical protein